MLGSLRIERIAFSLATTVRSFWLVVLRWQLVPFAFFVQFVKIHSQGVVSKSVRCYWLFRRHLLKVSKLHGSQVITSRLQRFKERYSIPLMKDLRRAVEGQHPRESSHEVHQHYSDTFLPGFTFDTSCQIIDRLRPANFSRVE